MIRLSYSKQTMSSVYLLVVAVIIGSCCLESNVSFPKKKSFLVLIIKIAKKHNYCFDYFIQAENGSVQFERVIIFLLYLALYNIHYSFQFHNALNFSIKVRRSAQMPQPPQMPNPPPMPPMPLNRLQKREAVAQQVYIIIS